jgi:hypothetical protein
VDVVESSAILTHFVLQIPCRAIHSALIDRLNCGQFGAISSEICGFLAQRVRLASVALRGPRNALLSLGRVAQPFVQRKV